MKNLNISFKTSKGTLAAVKDVTFNLKKGEILGVVGESGCGKSVTASSIMGLLNTKNTIIEGEINYKGQNLVGLQEKEYRKIRGNVISMVHQNPMTALDPLYRIGDQIVETIRLHQKVSKAEAKERAIELLKKVRIPSAEEKIRAYPHQLSGGMKQRVMIALALACQPDILIADEPTTALDVTIQSQILKLLLDLQQEFQMSIIFITHDLGVVAEFCEKVMVMYLGQIVESTTVEELFRSPQHPYTKGLLKAAPTIKGNRNQKLFNIKGAVPPLSQIPAGCRFANRCVYAEEVCSSAVPELKTINEQHLVRCWKTEQLAEIEENAEVMTFE